MFVRAIPKRILEGSLGERKPAGKTRDMWNGTVWTAGAKLRDANKNCKAARHRSDWRKKMGGHGQEMVWKGIGKGIRGMCYMYLWQCVHNQNHYAIIWMFSQCLYVAYCCRNKNSYQMGGGCHKMPKHVGKNTRWFYKCCATYWFLN